MIDNYIEKIKESFYKDYSVLKNEETNNTLSVTTSGQTNVVSGEKLRKIQSETLSQVKDFLSKTFGPMGSNTKIIKGNNKDNISSIYSKDGLKVLQNIINSGPIEASIIEELIDITRHVEKEVGDGTTSTVILSSLIFDKLMVLQNKFNVPPYQLIKTFEEVVLEIKDIILSHKHECTIEDIYDICMISTNSNEYISKEIKDIYEKFGMDVDLSVGISNNENTYVKEYDGLTITEGYSDPVFINNNDNKTSEIPNARVYHFVDPIDTMEMITYFEKIIEHNLYDQIEDNMPPIPTVITCPRISRDMSATLKHLSETLYQMDKADASNAKPPVLIITNVIGSDEAIMDDISNLCGCKSIRKYIDPKIQKLDQDSGAAPTIENVFAFFGECELVVADAKKTKFINPKHMHIYNEDGTITDDPIYTGMINFLESEIEHEKNTDGSIAEIGGLKKRLAALKANMVEFLVGGVSIAERDAYKDLIEDAVKNCRSASLAGVGYASNFEALRAIKELEDNGKLEDINSLKVAISRALYTSYIEIQEILYSTVSSDKKEIDDHIEYSINTEDSAPYNISSGSLPELTNLGHNVKCSIMLDINILDTISKIISLMVTCNQCLLQSTLINNY